MISAPISLRIRHALAASGAALALAACGGGGGGGESVPTAAAELQLLPFITAANELKLFNPRLPTAEPVLADTELATTSGSTLPVLGGRYRPADHGLDDPHHPLMLYIRQGQVFRLGLLPDGTPVPVRVSSIADACQLARVFPDFAIPEESRLLVIRQGEDPNCSTPADNLAGFTRLSADATTDPVPLSAEEMPSLALYADDGSVLGLLARTGPTSGSGVLIRYDADLQSGSPVADLASGSPVDFGGPRPDAGHAYLRLKVAGTDSTCLHRYTESSTSLSDCLHAYSGTLRSLALSSQADAQHAYWSDGNQVLRIAHDGTPATPLFTGPATYSATALLLSSTRIIVNYIDTGNSSVHYGIDSLARTGGAAIALRSGATRPLTISAVAGNRLYLYDELIVEASAILDNGSGNRVLPGTRWGGFTKSRLGISIGATAAFDDAYHGTFVQARSTSASSLTSFNAGTGSGIAALGTTMGQVLNATSGGFGRYRLSALRVARTNSSGTGSTIDVDVYFYDSLDEGSLRPLAITQGGSDRIVF